MVYTYPKSEQTNLILSQVKQLSEIIERNAPAAHYGGNRINCATNLSALHTYSRADQDQIAARQITILSTPKSQIDDRSRTIPLPRNVLNDDAQIHLQSILSRSSPQIPDHDLEYEH